MVSSSSSSSVLHAVIGCLGARISFRVLEINLFLHEVLQVSNGGLNGKTVVVVAMSVKGLIMLCKFREHFLFDR